MPAKTRCYWADLPPDLVQLIAGEVGDADRQALVRTCAAWCTAIEAVPDLWPTAVIAAPSGLNIYRWRNEAISVDIAEECHDENVREEARVLEAASQLDRLTWRVRLEGGWEHAVLWCGVLAVLPPTVRELQLDAVCAGPLLTVLRRFRHLRTLSITGNGARIAWSGSGAASVVPKLTQLCLDYRQRREWQDEYYMEARVLSPPVDVVRCLTGATGLRSLELMVDWSDTVRTLCCSLPALKDLRLSLYTCIDNDSAQAVAMLQQLPELTEAALAIHSYWGTEDTDGEWPYVDDWEDWVYLRAMAGISALTRLCMVGAVSLPPDWTQLRSLRSLDVVNDAAWALEQLQGDDGWKWGGFDWGQQPLTALTALTKLKIGKGLVLPDANLAATTPALKQVDAEGASNQWWAELRGLLPDLCEDESSSEDSQEWSGSEESGGSEEWGSSEDELSSDED